VAPVRDFRARVIAALASVGPGQVVSYGDLAAEAGYPGAARGVGAVLAGNGDDGGLPWWRVVYGDGRLAPGHEREQARRLAAEGVTVRGGRVAGRPTRPGTPARRPQGEQPAREQPPRTADAPSRRG
jgi:methylated-DNA-protein-cysteine methyltransferase-like protein